MTKQQIDLLIEANNLAERLLSKLLETSTMAEQIKNDFSNWLALQTKCNRISTILTKAQSRCRRRALIYQK